MKRFSVIAAALSMLYFGGAQAAPINPVAAASVGPNVVDFNDIPTAVFPGVTYDGIIASGGVHFAERFVGQTLGFNGDLDVLSGTPSGPLTLQVGAPSQNLSGGADGGVIGLYPCGQLGCTNPNGYGEGSFAALFSTGVSAFAFDSIFSEGNSQVFVDVFRADGSLIQSLAVNNTLTGFGVNSFGFAREGNVADIAGFSVYTNDPGGLAYDNIRYTGGPAVPEPGTLALMLAGLSGLALLRGRRKSIA